MNRAWALVLATQLCFVTTVARANETAPAATRTEESFSGVLLGVSTGMTSFRSDADGQVALCYRRT